MEAGKSEVQAFQCKNFFCWLHKKLLNTHVNLLCVLIDVLILTDQVVSSTLKFQKENHLHITVIDVASKMTFYFLKQENSISKFSVI